MDTLHALILLSWVEYNQQRQAEFTRYAQVIIISPLNKISLFSLIAFFSSWLFICPCRLASSVMRL